MVTEVISLEEGENIDNAKEKFSWYRFGALPVTSSDDSIRGVVTYRGPPRPVGTVAANWDASFNRRIEASTVTPVCPPETTFSIIAYRYTIRLILRTDFSSIMLATALT